MRDERSVALAATLVLLVACGGDDGDGPAGGAGSAGSAGSAGRAGSAGGPGLPPLAVDPPVIAAPAPPAPPAEAAPPALTPCAGGWQPADVGGSSGCEPAGLPSVGPCPAGWVAAGETCEPGPLPSWTCPAGWLPEPRRSGTPQAFTACRAPELPASCPAGQMPLVGQSACQPIGPACPAGEWGELPSGVAIVYVKAGVAGGDGTAGKPFGSIGQAVAAAPGAVVALAKGEYVERVVVSQKLTIVGACAGATRLIGPVEGALEVVAGGALEVRGLRVGGAGPGLKASAGASLVARGVWVDGATGDGVKIDDASAVFEAVAITGTAPDAAGERGYGLSVDGASHIEARGLSVERNHTVGARFKGATTFALEQTLVRGTLSRPKDGVLGRGLDAQLGARGSVTRSLLTQNFNTGLIAFDPGTEVTLSQVEVRQTAADGALGQFGDGLSAQQGAKVVGEQVWLAQSHTGGVTCLDAGSRVELSRAVIEGTLATATQASGGVVVGTGARVELTAALLEANAAQGVKVQGATSSFEATDVIIAGTQFDGSLAGGFGLSAAGGQVTLTRALLEGNRAAGVLGIGAKTQLEADGLVVRSTLPASDETLGNGLLVADGAQAALRGVWVTGNRTAAVSAAGASTRLTLADAVIERTTALSPKEAQGDGISVLGAAVTLERVTVRHNTGIGVGVFGAGPVVTASDLTVVGLASGAPAGLTGPGDIGILVDAGGRLTGERVEVRFASLGGVYAQQAGSEVTLRDARVMNAALTDPSDLLAIGVAALGGARVTLERTLVSGSRPLGVAAQDAGSQLDATDLIVHGTRTQTSSNQFGQGFVIQDSATGSCTRCRFVDNGQAGALVATGGQATFTDVQVQKTNVDLGADGLGVGVVVQLGGQLTARRLLTEDMGGAGILVTGSGSRLDAADLVQRRIGSSRDRTEGIGLQVQRGATGRVERARIEQTRRAGLGAIGEGTVLELLDTEIGQTLGEDITGRANAAFVGSGGLLKGTRLSLHDNVVSGLVVIGGRFEGSDVAIDSTTFGEINGDESGGEAIRVRSGQLTIERLQVKGSRSSAISLSGATTAAELRSVSVSSTAAQENGTNGIGLLLTGQASLTLTDAWLDGNLVSGVVASDRSTFKASRLFVSRTLSGSFVPLVSGEPTGAPILDVGDGLVVNSGATLDLADATFVGCARSGVLMADATGTLRRVRATDNRFGLVVQGTGTPDYDASCVFDGNREGGVLGSGNLAVPQKKAAIPPPQDDLTDQQGSTLTPAQPPGG